MSRRAHSRRTTPPRSGPAAEQREARATIAAYANHIQARSLRNAELEAENATLREALNHGGSAASLPVAPRMLPPE
ncbi:hypothetical protein [Streptomyces paradoxus]|uniref:hypothetical protein n=1 Tax=Streptomyces paradoxus TaxID=66375 RepID=UPI0037F1F1A1